MAKIKVTNTYGYPNEDTDFPSGEGVDIFLTDPYKYHGGGPENVRTITFKGNFQNLQAFADIMAEEVMEAEEITKQVLALGYVAIAYSIQVGKPEVGEQLYGFLATAYNDSLREEE